MHLCDDAEAARESLPPDLCVDLSQCTLRWISKASASGKRKNVIEIKSTLLGIEMNLHFDQHYGAAGWIVCVIKLFIVTLRGKRTSFSLKPLKKFITR